MKKILTILAIVLFATGCSSSLAFYSETPYKMMQGKIAKATETTYPATKADKAAILNNNLVETFTYSFNQQGQLLTSAYSSKNKRHPNISTTFTYSKGSIAKRVSTSRDEDGKEIIRTYERIKYSKDQSTFVEYTNTDKGADTIVANYDYIKQLVTENRKNKNGKLSKSTITFADYRKQQLKQYTGQKLNYTKTFKYDDRGFLTNEKSVWEKGEASNIKTKYTKFDDHNNWIECEIYANNVLQSVTKREIVYK